MKKILTGFSVGALSLLVAGIALAQSDTTTKAPLRPAAQGVRATVVPKKVAEKMENKETRDARPLAQERKNNVMKRAEGMITGINRMIDQIEKHIGKVGTLIAKFEARGANTTDAKTHLELAKSKLNEVKAKAAEIKSSTQDIGTAQTPRDAIKAFRGKIKELQALIKETRAHIVESIVGLKNGMIKRDATATSTENKKPNN